MSVAVRLATNYEKISRQGTATILLSKHIICIAIVQYILLYFNVFHYNFYIKKVEVHSQQLIGSSKNFFISLNIFFALIKAFDVTLHLFFCKRSKEIERSELN